MKVVSDKNHGKQASMASFRGLVMESWKNAGSQVSAIIVVPILSPISNSFLLWFYAPVLCSSNIYGNKILLKYSINILISKYEKSQKSRKSFIPALNTLYVMKLTW